MKLGMMHWGIKSIIVYSNDDPELTLTYLQQGRNCNLGFYIGKCDNDGFFENYCRIKETNVVLKITRPNL